LRAEQDFGRVLKPELSALGTKRLAQLNARAEAGETITEIELRDCELRFVPEDIRQFSGIRRLCVSKNEVKESPDWIAEFSHLEILERALWRGMHPTVAVNYRPTCRIGAVEGIHL
jgi:hypothetical protein